MPTTGITFIEDNWDCLSDTPLPKPHQIKCLFLSQALRCRGSCCCCVPPYFGVNGNWRAVHMLLMIPSEKFHLPVRILKLLMLRIAQTCISLEVSFFFISTVLACKVDGPCLIALLFVTLWCSDLRG